MNGLEHRLLLRDAKINKAAVAATEKASTIAPRWRGMWTASSRSRSSQVVRGTVEVGRVRSCARRSRRGSTGTS